MRFQKNAKGSIKKEKNQGVDEFKPKLMSKSQLFYNSCYICLYGAILMEWESWKVVLIE